MGLQLYQAPVECDVQRKPAAEKASAQARSSIRRIRQGARDQTRERQRRILATAAAAGEQPRPQVRQGLPSQQDLGLNEPDWASSMISISAGPIASSSSSGNPAQSRRALRNTASHVGNHDDLVAATFGGARWGSVTDGSREANDFGGNEERNESADVTNFNDLDFQNRRRLGTLNEASISASTNHSAQILDYARTSYLHTAQGASQGSGSFRDSRSWRAHREQGLLENSRLRQVPRETRRFDGLGDRARSLSPENDHWHTLLSTITPDPQPPSAGTSFASNSASIVASQTGPDTFPNSDLVEETGVEPSCDSDRENRETDVDDDEDQEQNLVTGMPQDTHIDRRSYADVARTHSSEDAMEVPDGTGNVQLMVRNLNPRVGSPEN